MPIYFGDKKIKEMYWGGRKIKEAWYEGRKVYSGGAPPWEPGQYYKVGDIVTDYGTYRCIADHQASTENKPYRGLLSGVYWVLAGGA